MVLRFFDLFLQLFNGLILFITALLELEDLLFKSLDFNIQILDLFHLLKDSHLLFLQGNIIILLLLKGIIEFVLYFLQIFDLLLFVSYFLIETVN